MLSSFVWQDIYYMPGLQFFKYRENGKAILGTTEICAETYLTNEEGPTIKGRLGNYHDDGNDRLKMIKFNSKLILM